MPLRAMTARIRTTAIRGRVKGRVRSPSAAPTNMGRAFTLSPLTQRTAPAAKSATPARVRASVMALLSHTSHHGESVNSAAAPKTQRGRSRVATMQTHPQRSAAAKACKAMAMLRGRR